MMRICWDNTSFTYLSGIHPKKLYKCNVRRRLTELSVWVVWAGIIGCYNGLIIMDQTNVREQWARDTRQNGLFVVILGYLYYIAIMLTEWKTQNVHEKNILRRTSHISRLLKCQQVYVRLHSTLSVKNKNSVRPWHIIPWLVTLYKDTHVCNNSTYFAD
jgi:hypothetical protein